MARHVYMETYGCQMNVADSELMFGRLRQAGFERVPRAELADVILLNTCAIREHAEQRVYGRLGELARYKLRRPGVVLGVAGCMAQHVRGKLMQKVPLVDLVVGPDGYRDLPHLIDEAREEPTLAVRLSRTETYADLVPARADGVRAWVSIMRGCDKFCTFCIVPFVRGRERSLPVDEVIRQVEHASMEGYQEVVFLGQTVNAYRDGDADFADLLRRATHVDGIRRIRFTSPHPSDMTGRTIEAIATSKKVCPQVHLPLQSGSDAVLKRMRRMYDVGEYLAVVKKLRAAVPGIALTTDIIVGFPGESVADFEATRALMRSVRYDSAFLFKYSAREGASSARWPETVSGEEKSRRLTVLIGEQKHISHEINLEAVGTEVEVLVEGPARRDPAQWFGKTAHFKTAVFPRREERVGDLIRMRVAAASPYTLFGENVPASALQVEDPTI